jgi:hypothetical protein
MPSFLLDTMTNGGYMEIANSWGLWLCVIPTVIVELIQAYVFIRDAINAGDIVGLTKKDCKEAMRAGAICTIGPGISMFTVMVAFMSIIGGPFAWLRLSIIGTITTEMLGATAGATAMGVELGGADYGIQAFTCSVWVITLNTWGFFIVNLLFAHRMESVKVAMEKHDIRMFNTIGGCLMIGCIAMFLAQQVVAGTPQLAAAVGGFVSMTILRFITRKHPRLSEYTLGIALIIGILIAQSVVEMGGI